MKSHRHLFPGLLALGLFSLVTNPVCRADTSYHLRKEIPGGGGWDYASADSASDRPYVAHAIKVVGSRPPRSKMIAGSCKILVYGPN